MLCVKDGRSVDIQYSNWQRTDPVMFIERECVVVTRLSYWITYNCYHQLPYVCQSQMITINACFWLCDSFIIVMERFT